MCAAADPLLLFRHVLSLSPCAVIVFTHWQVLPFTDALHNRVETACLLLLFLLSAVLTAGAPALVTSPSLVCAPEIELEFDVKVRVTNSPPRRVPPHEIVSRRVTLL